MRLFPSITPRASLLLHWPTFTPQFHHISSLHGCGFSCLLLLFHCCCKGSKLGCCHCMSQSRKQQQPTSLPAHQNEQISSTYVSCYWNNSSLNNITPKIWNKMHSSSIRKLFFLYLSFFLKSISKCFHRSCQPFLTFAISILFRWFDSNSRLSSFYKSLMLPLYRSSASAQKSKKF